MDQKTFFAKVDRSAQKPRGRHLSRPRQPFWGPQAAILDFAGVSGGERVSPFAARLVFALSTTKLFKHVIKIMKFTVEIYSTSIYIYTCLNFNL